METRAQQLNTSRRRHSVLETVSGYLSFEEEWDDIARKLPCPNGVIDLTTGIFSPSKPDQYIKSLCPTNYNPSATCPNFEKFLSQIFIKRNSEGIFVPDFELIEFIQILFGYIMIGVPLEEIVIYLYGEDGRNGKGTLVKVILGVLGHLVATLPSGMILMQKNPPSHDSASPSFAKLQGKRFAILSEINKKRKIDSAVVKFLSGGDQVPCRKLYQDQSEFPPSHTLMLQTNYKPEAPADDNGLWERTVLITFNASFVRGPKKDNERPLNNGLKEELLQESEGILNWLIRGSLKYQEVGLCIPQSVKDQTAQYREENDPIGRFIREKCTLDHVFRTGCQNMITAIKNYCIDEEIRDVPTKYQIDSYMKNKLNLTKEVTNKGNFWRGISIIPEIKND